MLMKKRIYSKEFKLQSIELAEQRENVSQVARELGIRADMLRRWVREYNDKKSAAFGGSGTKHHTSNNKLVELQRLKRELRQVKLERDILKKAVSIFSKSDSINIDSL